ncbi:MAG: hypothetical protein HXS54_02260, partial [Theionarchaea archaeon]|nr:hypothetical protein [Theionarchaea archaeon]
MDDTPNEYGKIHLRQFEGPSDFDIIAHINNQSAVTHYGDGATLVEGVIIEDMVSSPERLQIAEIDKIPVGFIFVIKEGRMQLDDFG